MNNETVQMIITLLGGLALFIFGMNFMSDGLQRSAGDKMRSILAMLTRNPVLGAVAGGVIGHQFGGGRGKDVATVVGALGGGYAGNQVQGAMQDNDTYTTTQQRCKTVYDKSEKMLGYDVTYKIGDQQGKIRMDKDPGTQIPLDGNGQLILNNKV